MMRPARGPSFSRLVCLSLTTSLTVLLLFGCGQEAVTQVKDTGHGAEVSKNQADFMKTNPYKNAGKEKVQLK
jgi:hypothetical protein